MVGEEADDGTYNKVPLRAIVVYIYSGDPKDILGENINVKGCENVEKRNLKIINKAYVLASLDKDIGLFSLSLYHIHILRNNVIQTFLQG